MAKSDDVYGLIVSRLVEGRYAFGERLLVKEIAAETGASRQPIMTALNRLSAEGFVKVIPQVGCAILDPSPTEIADFFLLFQMLEGLLAELAAVRRTESELLELQLIQSRIVALEQSDTRSPAEYLALNQKFHQCIHGMSHSPLLERKQRNNFNMSDFFINHSVGFSGIMTNAVHGHDRMIAAITERDSERARKEAEEHIAEISAAVLDQLQAA